MNILKLLATVAIATAAFGASAADLSKPVESLTWDEHSAAFFGHAFAARNRGNSFVDHYRFTTSTAGSLSGRVSSLGGGAMNGLAVTDFSLFDGSGKLLTADQVSTGNLDLWTLNYAALAPGDYYVQVSGSVLGKGATRYTASLALAPVPEPQTYAMMFGGLGLLAIASRRRKQPA